MPTNVSPEFSQAQKTYFESKTDEEKLLALEAMKRTMPQHKSAENLRANIRQRYKKLKKHLEKKARQKKSGKPGIKKQGIQVILAGLTNSGKSSLLSILTNAKPEIESYKFTTKKPAIGALNLEGINFQIIDMPAVNYEEFDQGLANTADILLIIVKKIEEIKQVSCFLEKSKGKRIIVFNKSDLLSSEQKRKIEATLKSRKYDFVLLSAKTEEGTENLKLKLLENSGVIRIYTKQPRKSVDKEPVNIKPPITIKELAEKVLKKGIKIKEVRITGPSSKFPNQKVGLNHILKDKDIVEFHTE